MRHAKLEEMVRGWFIGGFKPSVLDTQACEVGMKTYAAGHYEGPHFHKIATEVTLVLSGRVYMCGKAWEPGDIVIVEPEEVTDFRALTDATNIVVKVPGALGDKYLVDNN